MFDAVCQEPESFTAGLEHLHSQQPGTQAGQSGERPASADAERPDPAASVDSWASSYS